MNMSAFPPGPSKPGDVVIANLVNGCENRGSRGKERPVVVVDASEAGHLTVAGLTSRKVARCGDVRIALRDTAGWRLRGRPYIWGDRLTRISRHDVFETIGHVSADDAGTIGEICGLASGWEA
jgi:hypothetical protein